MTQHFYDHQEKIARKSYYQLSSNWCVCAGYILVSGDSSTNLSLLKAMECSSDLSLLKTYWSILHSPKLLNLLLFSKLGKASLNHSFIIKIISGECPFDKQTSVLNSAILHFLRYFFFKFWHYISIAINLCIF